jgi:hypothetical protein
MYAEFMEVSMMMIYIIIDDDEDDIYAVMSTTSKIEVELLSRLGVLADNRS